MARLSRRVQRKLASAAGNDRSSSGAAQKAATPVKKAAVKRQRCRSRRLAASPSATSGSSSSLATWSDSLQDVCTRASLGDTSSMESSPAPSDVDVLMMASVSPALAELSAVVINLDKRPDRMETCAQSFALHSPWLSYSRLPAVDGRKECISDSEVAQSWHTATNCEYQRIRSRRKGWDDLHTYVPRRLKLSPGERGCSLSHVRAWRYCVELGRPLMVLEDDAALMPEFTPTLERAVAALPADAQVLYLGYSQAADWRRELTPDLVEAEYLWTTVGYIIWPSGARALLDRLPVDQPVDNFMATLCARGGLKSYAVRPKLVRQAEAWNVASDVGHSDELLGHVLQTAGAPGGRNYLSHNTHHSVDMWCEMGCNQKWILADVGDGLHAIQTFVSTNSGRTYLSHDCHSRVDLWSEAGVNQKWRIRKVAEDTYTIQAASMGDDRSYLARDSDSGVHLSSEPERWTIPLAAFSSPCV